jgi:hypothetical protein
VIREQPRLNARGIQCLPTTADRLIACLGDMLPSCLGLIILRQMTEQLAHVAERLERNEFRIASGRGNGRDQSGCLTLLAILISLSCIVVPPIVSNFDQIAGAKKRVII